MKTVLRSLVFVAFIAFSTEKLNAQCAVSDIYVQNIRPAGTQTTGSCTVTFDVTFNIENNSGNKFIFIHAWLQNDYPDYFKCVNGQPTRNGAIKAPEAADLGNEFLNIGIDNSGAVSTILTTYPADNSVILNSVISVSKVILPDGSANITLMGVTTTVPVTCGTPVVVVADIWSSQAANGRIAHCVNCGIRSSAGFISVTGLVNCTNLTYGATVTNNTGNPLTGFYKVYADVNGDGYFTPVTDTLISGPINYSIVAGPGTTTFINGILPGANLNQNVFLVFTQTTGVANGASRVILLRSTQCSPLPVTFTSFSAKRMNKSNVSLKWETATEINNSGFALQRNTGNNNWQTITVIKSKAISGNSDQALLYTYNDLNATQGISQYRVQQVDIDGKSKFSEIRAVRGEGQRGETIVYPNPSYDGRVNVVFEDIEGVRNVALMDISGRMIKQWKVSNGNTIFIDNLAPGLYSLRIVSLDSREQSFKKILVAGTK